MYSIRNTLRNAERYFSDTPLKTKWLYMRRKVLRRFSRWTPRQLWIGITYQCQCQCIHCFLGSQLNENKGELTKEEIYDIVNTAKKLGFMEVSYFGGEPLLRKDITELIRFSSSMGLLTSIFTNGILLTQEKAKELREAGLFFCNVSMDSASPEQHNSLRGYKGCFEKTVEGIKHLTDVGIKSSIWTYVKKTDVQDQALNDLEAIIEIGHHLKIYKVIILFPMASGKWLCGANTILTQAEREKVRAFHNPPFVELEFPSEDAPCTAGKRLVYISPQGDVLPCPVIPHSLGNIRQESLSTILKKLNSKLIESKLECYGRGQCAMNIDFFRKKIGIEKIDTL